jgi:hypothetical protein
MGQSEIKKATLTTIYLIWRDQPKEMERLEGRNLMVRDSVLGEVENPVVNDADGSTSQPFTVEW